MLGFPVCLVNEENLSYLSFDGMDLKIFTRKPFLQSFMKIRCYASVNSKHQHPPRADPRGNFLKWSKILPRGKIFLQKHGPRDKKIPTPGEYCERSSQLFLLVGVEISKFCRNQTLKRTGRLFKSYPLVSV